MATSFLKLNICKNHFSGLLILTTFIFFNSNITVNFLSENQPLLDTIHNPRVQKWSWRINTIPGYNHFIVCNCGLAFCTSLPRKLPTGRQCGLENEPQISILLDFPRSFGWLPQSCDFFYKTSSRHYFCHRPSSLRVKLTYFTQPTLVFFIRCRLVWKMRDFSIYVIMGKLARV